MALTFNRMWAYAAYRGRLLGADTTDQMVQSVNKQFRLGPPIYFVAFLLAFVSAEASLAICIALAVFFALPSTVTRALLRRS